MYNWGERGYICGRVYRWTQHKNNILHASSITYKYYTINCVCMFGYVLSCGVMWWVEAYIYIYIQVMCEDVLIGLRVTQSGYDDEQIKPCIK